MVLIGRNGQGKGNFGVSSKGHFVLSVCMLLQRRVWQMTTVQIVLYTC
jgi:hypothetical protein